MLKLRPIVAGLLKVLHSILQLPLFTQKSLYFCKGVLSSVFLQGSEPFSQILILLGELEDFCVAIVELFGLLLYGRSERQVSLEYFFHHIQSVHDSLCNCIFGFVGGTVGLARILLFLVAGYVFQLICLFLKEFVHFLLIFHDPAGYDLPVLY